MTGGVGTRVAERLRRGVGDSVRRIDGIPKVRGEFDYGSDLRWEGMLWGATLRAPHAHARIRSIDIGEALAAPGVRSVLTADDVPGRRTYGLEFVDQPVLAWDRVRYEGEPVAIVAAEHREQARRAAGLIAVDYEELPAVTDMEEALRPEAARLHEHGKGVTRGRRRAQVAADRSAIADLRGPHRPGRLHQRHRLLHLAHDPAVRDPRAQEDPILLVPDLAELGEGGHVEHRVGSPAVEVQLDHQVGASCDRDGLGVRGLHLQRLLQGAGCEHLHQVPPSPVPAEAIASACRPMSSRRTGTLGRSRPVAARRAFTIAGVDDSEGSSPTPFTP